MVIVHGLISGLNYLIEMNWKNKSKPIKYQFYTDKQNLYIVVNSREIHKYSYPLRYTINQQIDFGCPHNLPDKKWLFYVDIKNMCILTPLTNEE